MALQELVAADDGFPAAITGTAPADAFVCVFFCCRFNGRKPAEPLAAKILGPALPASAAGGEAGEKPVFRDAVLASAAAPTKPGSVRIPSDGEPMPEFAVCNIHCFLSGIMPGIRGASRKLRGTVASSNARGQTDLPRACNKQPLALLHEVNMGLIPKGFFYIRL